LRRRYFPPRIQRYRSQPERDDLGLGGAAVFLAGSRYRTPAALLPHRCHAASGGGGLCVSDRIDAGREPLVELSAVGQHTIVEPAAAQLRRTNRAVGLAVVADSAWHFAGGMEPTGGVG